MDLKYGDKMKLKYGDDHHMNFLQSSCYLRFRTNKPIYKKDFFILIQNLNKRFPNNKIEPLTKSVFSIAMSYDDICDKTFKHLKIYYCNFQYNSFNGKKYQSLEKPIFINFDNFDNFENNNDLFIDSFIEFHGLFKCWEFKQKIWTKEEIEIFIEELNKIGIINTTKKINYKKILMEKNLEGRILKHF